MPPVMDRGDSASSEEHSPSDRHEETLVKEKGHEETGPGEQSSSTLGSDPEIQVQPENTHDVYGNEKEGQIQYKTCEWWSVHSLFYPHIQSIPHLSPLLFAIITILGHEFSDTSYMQTGKVLLES
jgi:hypothetical protein